MPAFLMFLGIGKSVMAWLSRRSLAELAAIALALVCVVQFLALKSEKRHSHKVEIQLQKSEQDRRDDRKAYEQAQKDAASKNLATVARVKAEQERINEQTKDDLNSRLERIRRELRDNPAAKGSAGRTPISAGGKASCRADDPAWLCLSPADRLRAAENEERHDRLIDWAQKQSEVR